MPDYGTSARNDERNTETTIHLTGIAEGSRAGAEGAGAGVYHPGSPSHSRSAAYRRTRKDGAVGIDGQTAADYAEDLEVNLQSLLDRAKSGRYRAPAVRRVNIPKGDGKSTRPIGIPTFEDKVLQRAVVMVMEVIYEQDFLSCSFGFRPGRSAHDALKSLREGTRLMGGGWVLEVDIKSFFDTLVHSTLRDLIRRRVCDGVLLRLIGKWLNAGVQEGGSIVHPESGTPQGGVVSPLLANIYLHYVLDLWFEQTVKPRLRGQAFLIRYADDVAIVFASENDARRVMEVLPKRFGKFGLTLHPEKTRLVEFRRPPRGCPVSFDFLGFTHFWSKSQKGFWIIKRKTAKNRLARALRHVNEWCRTHRHMKVKEQHRALVRKLQGHCAYYGITGNSQALWQFRRGMLMQWRRWLTRRSQKAKRTWDWFNQFLRTYDLPPAIAVHSQYRRAARP